MSEPSLRHRVLLYLGVRRDAEGVDAPPDPLPVRSSEDLPPFWREFAMWLGKLVSVLFVTLGIGFGILATLLMLDHRAYVGAVIGALVTSMPLLGAMFVRRGGLGDGRQDADALGAAGLLALFPLIVGFGLIAGSAGL